MSSTNGSGRPSGCISIPVEIIRDSNPNPTASHSRHDSPFRTLHNENPYGDFPDPPQWNPPMNSHATSRLQPRQGPNTAYDRVINNSQFNQPLNDRSYQTIQDPQARPPQQRMYDQGPSQFSRSNEDLLSSFPDSMRYSGQPQFTSLIPPTFGSGFRPESDFLQSSKYTSPLRRSFDALNDFADMQQSFPTQRQYPSEHPQQQQQQQQQQPYYRSSYQTQHQPQPQQQQYQQQPTYSNQTYFNPNIVYTNEYGVPTDQHPPNTFQERGQFSNDRSRSPGPQRGASPARPSPSPSTQLQEEPELKMAKDSAGPIPMPPPAASSASVAADQQVPSADASASHNSPPSPPAPEPVRDPNTIALEKLEQIKQMLLDLDQQVEAFTGSTRHERAYKLLDEQALKIMIRCDELVDVSADIKEKRKEMIRNVEKVIGKLESRVPATPAAESNSNPLESTGPSQTSSMGHEQQNSGKTSSSSSSPPKESLPTSATEQSSST